MQTKPHILVVDDHKSIRDPLAEYLEQNHYRVTVAENATEMGRVLKGASIDLIVLDILLPGEGGLEICRRIRATKDIPIILLTALGEETDIIVGLEMGADDYVTKPFNPRELLARIKNVLRRTNTLPKQFGEVKSGYFSFSGWVLNIDRRILKKELGEKEISLSTVEYKLLLTFLTHPRIVLTRDQLLDMVSNRASDVFDRSIDNQVSRLRKKIEADPKKPQILKTIWGGGYMLASEVVRT